MKRLKAVFYRLIAWPLVMVLRLAMRFGLGSEATRADMDETIDMYNKKVSQ